MIKEKKDVKILITDDSLFMRQYLIGFLSDEGYENFTEAENGEVALQKYEEVHPDIVFLDLNMPIKGGIETLNDLVQEGAKVVIISAVSQEPVTNTVLDMGAIGYFTKPFFSSKDLDNKIHEALSF
jgi:two-component system chemotaxis response regulator CheY